MKKWISAYNHLIIACAHDEQMQKQPNGKLNNSTPVKVFAFALSNFPRERPRRPNTARVLNSEEEKHVTMHSEMPMQCQNAKWKWQTSLSRLFVQLKLIWLESYFSDEE